MNALLQKHRELFPRYKAIVEYERERFNDTFSQFENAIKEKDAEKSNILLGTLGDLYTYGDTRQKNIIKFFNHDIIESHKINISDNKLKNKKIVCFMPDLLLEIMLVTLSVFITVVFTILFYYCCFTILFSKDFPLVSFLFDLSIVPLFIEAFRRKYFCNKEEYGLLEEEVPIMEKALDISHEKDVPVDMLTRPSIQQYASA